MQLQVADEIAHQRDNKNGEANVELPLGRSRRGWLVDCPRDGSGEEVVIETVLEQASYREGTTTEIMNKDSFQDTFQIMNRPQQQSDLLIIVQFGLVDEEADQWINDQWTKVFN